MTTEQRILRLECMLIAIFDTLPTFIKMALPGTVIDTLYKMKAEHSEPKS